MRLLLLLSIAGLLGDPDHPGIAQPVSATPASLSVPLTHQQTTHLIFPASIRYVDRGSRQVLVQKVKGVENVLGLKAAGPDLQPTNLTVITADGTLHAFALRFDFQPSQLVHAIRASDGNVRFVGESRTETQLQAMAQRLVWLPGYRRGPRHQRGKVSLTLEGVYADRDALFLQLRLANRSALDYSSQSVRCYLEDPSTPKPSPRQQRDLVPRLVWPDPSGLPSGSVRRWVVVLPKAAGSADKKLVLTLAETGGDRSMRLTIRPRLLRQALPLSLENNSH